MRNLSLLNILWDGGTHSIGRRTSESFTVRGARLTMGLMIQEITLREYFSKSGGLARGMGFLARFLVAWPESTIGTCRIALTRPPVLVAVDRAIAFDLTRLSSPLFFFHDISIVICLDLPVVSARRSRTSQAASERSGAR